MKYIYFIFLLFGFLTNTIIGQDTESDCPEITNKRAIKYYKMGLDKKKYDKRERNDFLEEAIAMEPEYVKPYFVLAMDVVKAAKYRSVSLKPAEINFLQVILICPNYHSAPYYYLGEIYLGRKDYENAVKHLKLFIDFDDKDPTKYEKDYLKKHLQAKDDYEYAKFFADIYANPVPFNPKTVKHVSTKKEEYLPLVSPDNELMFFTRRSVIERKVKSSYVQNDKVEIIERFTISNRINKNEFEVGVPMEEPFNQYDKFNYGGATISIDNKHLFVTVCKPASMGYTNCDIYSSDLVYEYLEQLDTVVTVWTDLKNLGDSINTPDGWESQPSLSADGSTLYFASAREGSRGIDIYKAEKDSNGVWRKAVNLGEPINTENNDKAPFIHSDSKTLYFASQYFGAGGHLGLGGFDVFYTKMDAHGNWSKPVNIGYPINSEKDEHGFVVSTDGKKVYFASDKLNGEGGGLDIFSFELYEKARPEEITLTKGQIKDEQGQVVKNAKIELKNIQTKVVKEIPIDTVDGKYVFIKRKDEDLVMNVKAKDGAFNARLFLSNDTIKKAIQKIDIEIKKLETKKSYKLNNIHYATNSAELTRMSLYILDEFIEYLKENTTMKIAIHGHTDNIGAEQDNLALSSDRAYSVMAYLQERGIPKYRLNFKGFGETRPVASNDTEKGRALNRRTEFVILAK